MSSLFETIVADLQNRVEMEQLEKRFAVYYDRLAESSVQEDSVWGALGEATLATQADEEEHQRQSWRVLGDKRLRILRRYPNDD
jgi:hypothetical protein